MAVTSSTGVLTGRLLSVPEAGEYLNTGERFVRRLVAERRIPYVKVGRYVRLDVVDLDALIAAGRVEANGGAA